MLSIRLLGATEVQLDGKGVTIRRRKSRALLYFVAAHPQPVSRSRLLALLWPDHTPQTARSNLRSTLYNLRQTIGEHLETDTDTVYLAGNVNVDVRDFVARMGADQRQAESTPDTEQLTATLDLYRGDFLADFDAPDTAEFEEWAALERERLRRSAIRGYDSLSRGYARAGKYQQALAAIENALALDSFQEDLQRTALELHYRAGDRAGAIRRFEEFRRLLHDDMGVPPMTETQALYDAIVTDTVDTGSIKTETIPSRIPGNQSAEKVVATDRAANAAGEPTAQPSAPKNRPSVPSAQTRVRTQPVPFVGRADELKRMAGLLHDRRLLFVEGEPGLGKTSLVKQFLAERLDADSIVLIGRARELESRLPYQPVIEALRMLQRDLAWPQWREEMQLAPLWQRETARLVPELCPDSAWEDEDAGMAAPTDADASRLWESVYQWLAALAYLRPVALFLDDLHWADPATLGLLGYVTRRIVGESAPIRLLAAGHPLPARSPGATFLQALVREDLLHKLTLSPLSSETVVELARKFSPHYAHPLGHWLYRSSEGIPFILVHLLRHAQESGLLDENGTVNIHRLPTEPVVPQTVYALIQTRLENLSESARRVLDAAVTVGREFEFEVAARASALSDTAALDALDELRRNRLILSVDGDRFAFDHTLTREVAYREVSEARHRLLHRRVAAALESLYPDRLNEIAGLLAHHYREGHAPEQAYPFAVNAGRRAAAVAAWQPAGDFYKQALDQMPAGVSSTERLQLSIALGKAHLHAGEMQEAIQVLHQAVEQARAENMPETLGEALQALAEALFNQARYGEAIAIAESFQEIDDPHVRFTVDFMWAAALAVGGSDLTTAAQHLLAAEARLDPEQDSLSKVRLAQISFELGSIDAQQGRLHEAVERYRRAMTLTTPPVHEDMARWHILACNNLAYHLYLLGDATASDYARKGYDLARERGFLNMNGYLLSTLGEIALSQGDLVQAEDYFAQGLALARRLALPERVAGITANLAHVALARAKPQSAIDLFEDALERAEEVPNRYLSAQVRLWLAPLLSPDRATIHLDAAQAIIDAADYGRLREQLHTLRQSINTVQ